MDLIIALAVFLILMAVGYIFGTSTEKKHYEDIRRREKRTLYVPVISYGAKTPLPHAHDAMLFSGSTVVASDYFKTFTANMVNLVGGKIVVYETLLDRARREAILRMKEDAIAWGATQLVNVRLESSNIGNTSSNNAMVAIEVVAYGTGIR